MALLDTLAEYGVTQNAEGATEVHCVRCKSIVGAFDVTTMPSLLDVTELAFTHDLAHHL